MYGHKVGVDLIPDSVEVNFAAPVLEWAQETAAARHGAALDLASGIGVTGHSFGGKLAALQYCGPRPGMPPVIAAALVSPVDRTVLTPTSKLAPDAVACLAAAGPTKGPVALIDGGVRGACNPPGIDVSYPDWVEATAPGSW